MAANGTTSVEEVLLESGDRVFMLIRQANEAITAILTVMLPLRHIITERPYPRETTHRANLAIDTLIGMQRSILPNPTFLIYQNFDQEHDRTRLSRIVADEVCAAADEAVSLAGYIMRIREDVASNEMSLSTTLLTEVTQLTARGERNANIQRYVANARDRMRERIGAESTFIQVSKDQAVSRVSRQLPRD